MESFNLEIGKRLLQENIVYLRDNLVYDYIKVSLIQAGILTKVLRNDIESKPTFQRIELIILHLLDSTPDKIQRFLEVLKDNTNGFGFVFEYLDHKLKSLTPRDVRIHNTEVSEKTRERNVAYRHTLMRLSHENQLGQLKQLQRFATDRWHKSRSQDMHALRVKTLADQFCMAIDSKIEYKRIKSDTSLLESGLFEKLQTALPFTENPTRSTMLYLARFGSAMSLAGKHFHDSLSFIEQAIQQSKSVYPCREIGMVYYIYFNMLSSEYEKNPVPTKKIELLHIAKKTLDHFSMENNEAVNCDYRRFLLIKMAMIYLGIGIYGEFIPNTKVGVEDMRSAKCYLQEIEKPEVWSRMEVRRKMFYSTSMSKIFLEENNVGEAIKHLENAKMFAVEGGYSRETHIIQEHSTSVKKL